MPSTFTPAAPSAFAAFASPPGSSGSEIDRSVAIPTLLPSRGERSYPGRDRRVKPLASRACVWPSDGSSTRPSTTASCGSASRTSTRSCRRTCSSSAGATGTSWSTPGWASGRCARSSPTCSNDPTIAVATHRHFDHTGGLHEFDEVVVHRDDAEAVANADGFASLRIEDYPPEELSGYDPPASLLTALPHEGFELVSYAVTPVTPTRIVDEGDEIDLGDRRSRSCTSPATRRARSACGRRRRGRCSRATACTRAASCSTSCPSRTSPTTSGACGACARSRVRIVHGGHDDSFGRARLLELIDGVRSGAGMKPVFFADAAGIPRLARGAPRRRPPSCGWGSTRRVPAGRASPGRRRWTRRCASAGSTASGSASTTSAT